MIPVSLCFLCFYYLEKKSFKNIKNFQTYTRDYKQCHGGISVMSEYVALKLKEKWVPN